MSDRVHDLEMERERKKQFWETAFQALLTSVGVMTILVIWLGVVIASHAG
jgi:spore maturation protein SpmA